MGRGKYDTCENCIHSIENRDKTYTCRLDKSTNESSDWCKHHKGENEDEDKK